MPVQLYIRKYKLYMCIKVHKLSHAQNMDDTWGTEMLPLKSVCGNAHGKGG